MMDQDPEMESLKNQLCQMKSVLPLVAGVEKVEMEKVINQLEELISTMSATKSQNGNGTETIGSNPDDEYALFSAEIASIEQEFNPSTTLSATPSVTGDTTSTEPDKGVTDIQEELTALEGMRCLAPHEERWGQIGYYPAMISEVVSEENDSEEGTTEEFNCVTDIKVRVVFLQPVVKSQLMCPFYKENCCKRSAFDCGYSHGEVVHLSKLRDYSEPDYSKIIPSARVLAKYGDDLWYTATVIKLTSGGNCKVVFDKDNEWLEVGIHETAPLQDSDDESSSQSEEDEETFMPYENDARRIECDLLSITSSDALADWEKYTTGFGSKLMMKMGYIMGKGLGKDSEGRIIPVPAVMVPPGMSLDQFMLMKEKRKFGNDSFSVEKVLKRAQKRHQHREKQLSQKKEVKSVFDFMNSRLSLTKDGVAKQNKPSTSQNVAKKSCNILKKDMLSVGEEIKKVSKDIYKATQSLIRNEGKDAAAENFMKVKLDELETKKNHLVRMENNIMKEQKSRSDKKKLTEF